MAVSRGSVYPEALGRVHHFTSNEVAAAITFVVDGAREGLWADPPAGPIELRSSAACLRALKMTGEPKVAEVVASATWALRNAVEHTSEDMTAHELVDICLALAWSEEMGGSALAPTVERALVETLPLEDLTTEVLCKILIVASLGTHETALKPVMRALLSRESSSGGWGALTNYRADVVSTAWVAIMSGTASLSNSLDVTQFVDAQAQVARWLREPDKELLGSRTTFTLACALEALASTPRRHARAMNEAAELLMKMRGPSGVWGSGVGEPPLYFPTAVALSALATHGINDFIAAPDAAQAILAVQEELQEVKEENRRLGVELATGMEQSYSALLRERDEATRALKAATVDLENVESRLGSTTIQLEKLEETKSLYEEEFRRLTALLGQSLRPESQIPLMSRAMWGLGLLTQTAFALLWFGIGFDWTLGAIIGAIGVVGCGAWLLRLLTTRMRRRSNELAKRRTNAEERLRAVRQIARFGPSGSSARFKAETREDLVEFYARQILDEIAGFGQEERESVAWHLSNYADTIRSNPEQQSEAILRRAVPNQSLSRELRRLVQRLFVEFEPSIGNAIVLELARLVDEDRAPLFEAE